MSELETVQSVIELIRSKMTKKESEHLIINRAEMEEILNEIISTYQQSL